MTNWSLLARAGKKTKERKRKILGPIRALVEKEETQGLEGISFASRVAEDLAKEAGLSWRDFTRIVESNCTGFTAADVRLILAKRAASQAVEKSEEEFTPEEEDPEDD